MIDELDLFEGKNVEYCETDDCIDVRINRETLSPERQRLLNEIIRFAKESALLFKQDVDEALEEYKERRGSNILTDDIIHKFKSKGYDLPAFTIMDGEEANQVLFELEDDDSDIWKLRENEILLIFNTSKPLARFWYRGDQDDNSENIKWGKFYAAGRDAVWAHCAEEILHGTLTLNRRNDAGQHDAKKYYYVWTVSMNDEDEL